MIRLPKLIEYFKNQIAISEGVIKNIFLSNGQNEIIATAGGAFEQASILSTLFNDSIFIIRLNLKNGEQVDKDQKPLQIDFSMGEKQVFLFFIKNLLILGVVVEEKTRALGHKMANDILKFIEEQMQSVVQWTENNDVY